LSWVFPVASQKTNILWLNLCAKEVEDPRKVIFYCI